jgi:hypothetical protein
VPESLGISFGQRPYFHAQIVKPCSPLVDDGEVWLNTDIAKQNRADIRDLLVRINSNPACSMMHRKQWL